MYMEGESPVHCSPGESDHGACVEGPEPEEGIGSSGGALEETHHTTGKHTKVRRMLQCTRTLVTECAAGKWWP